MSDDTTTNIFSSFEAIPIEYLISTPLMAACRSNVALAQAMVEFIDEIAYDSNGDTNLIIFTLSQPVQSPSDGTWSGNPIKIEAPLLALVTIPSLLVDDVTIDFTATVDQSLSKTTEKDTDYGGSVGGSFGFGSLSMTGSVTTQRNNTRSTDYSATYTFHVEAEQQPNTEGMNTLMDVFASVMTPVPADTDLSSGSSGGTGSSTGSSTGTGSTGSGSGSGSG